MPVIKFIAAILLGAFFVYFIVLCAVFIIGGIIRLLHIVLGDLFRLLFGLLSISRKNLLFMSKSEYCGFFDNKNDNKAKMKTTQN